MALFYAPNIDTTLELPEDEAAHCLRVLRLGVGSELEVTDGNGNFYKTAISSIVGKHCYLEILEKNTPEKGWRGHLHLAIAPTKNMDRTEWFAEKATEIGFDEITFLNCRFSERKKINMERIEKIVISAMKQSHKSEMPVLNDMVRFEDFVKQPFSGDKFICHCYEESGLDNKILLRDALLESDDSVVLVGPEGDFSIDEVKLAIENGFRSVSLGNSRLRTETAALVAVHLMRLK